MENAKDFQDFKGELEALESLEKFQEFKKIRRKIKKYRFLSKEILRNFRNSKRLLWI